MNIELLVGPPSKFFDAGDIDFEEFEHILKALVAQLINLLQTLIDSLDTTALQEVFQHFIEQTQ